MNRHKKTYHVWWKQDAQWCFESSKCSENTYPTATRVQWVVACVYMTERFGGKYVSRIRELFYSSEILHNVILCCCKHNPEHQVRIMLTITILTQCEKNVQQVLLRCTFSKWCWELISQSASPHQGNFQSSTTSAVVVLYIFLYISEGYCLDIFTIHARMLVETAWPGHSVPVNIAHGLWSWPHSRGHSLAIECPVKASEYSQWIQSPILRSHSYHACLNCVTTKL